MRAVILAFSVFFFFLLEIRRFCAPFPAADNFQDERGNHKCVKKLGDL